MDDRQPYSTLREWRRVMTSPPAIAVFPAVAALLALIAPYGTGEILRPLPRFGYWLAMAAATYSAGFLATQAMTRYPGHRHRRVVRLAAVAAATGLAVAPTVVAVNAALLGRLPALSEMPLFLVNVFAVAVIVSVLLQILDGAPREAGAVDAAAAPILDRLPFDKRGDLVALSVEDHYVRVRTTMGEEMILMRLADAMKETGAVEGLQVHRSYWVALDRVRGVRRLGDRAVLSMDRGPEIPVSRRHLPRLREAGLLPR